MKNFIDIATTEDEQLEQLKSWWKENRTSIISGVIIALVVVFSWKGYKSYKLNYQLEARTAYIQLLSETSQSNFNKLKNNYANSSYLIFAKLLMAKKYFEDKKYSDALTLLNEVKENEDPNLQHISRLRIATIYITQKKYQQALDTLNEVIDAKSFITQYESLKGDVLVYQNKIPQAKTHYQLAIKNAKNDTIKSINQLKLNDIK